LDRNKETCDCLEGQKEKKNSTEVNMHFSSSHTT